MLQTIALYQIIIWLYLDVLLVKDLVDINFSEINIGTYIFKVAVIVASTLIVYGNSILLLKQKSKIFRECLIVNRWANFIQIFHLSVFGFNFYIILGLHFLIYYSYDEIQKIGIGYDLFRVSMEVNYAKSNIIIAGINLIPLIIFIILNKIINKFDRGIENELIENI